MTPNPLTPSGTEAPRTPADIAPTLGLDYFVNLNRPALEAMTAINKRFLEQLATFNTECASFAQTRFAQEVGLAQQLSSCRSPQDLFRAYSDFAQVAVEQYQDEFARMTRMGQEFGNQAAEIVRDRIEAARRGHSA